MLNRGKVFIFNTTINNYKRNHQTGDAGDWLTSLRNPPEKSAQISKTKPPLNRNLSKSIIRESNISKISSYFSDFNSVK